MKKTVFIAWNGQNNPITVSESATVQQIVQNPQVKATLRLPDNCIACFNGVQDYDGPISDQQTIQIISRPANKA